MYVYMYISIEEVSYVSIFVAIKLAAIPSFKWGLYRYIVCIVLEEIDVYTYSTYMCENHSPKTCCSKSGISARGKCFSPTGLPVPILYV